MSKREFGCSEHQQGSRPHWPPRSPSPVLHRLQPGGFRGLSGCGSCQCRDHTKESFEQQNEQKKPAVKAGTGRHDRMWLCDNTSCPNPTPAIAVGFALSPQPCSKATPPSDSTERGGKTHVLIGDIQLSCQPAQNILEAKGALHPQQHCRRQSKGENNPSRGG